jgi:hypothetical protein
MKKVILIALMLIFAQVLSAQFYPYNPNLGQKIQTDVTGTNLDRGFITHFEVSASNAVAASTTGVLAAVTDTGAYQIIPADSLTDPAVPRNITATAGGTAGDIADSSQVVIWGKDYAGTSITDSLTSFTENTAGTIQGTLAFASIDSVYLPVMDGTGATISIGWGDKLGLPLKLSHNTVLFAFLNNTLEGTAPTVTVSSSVLSSNTIDLNSALNGTKVDVYLID